MSIFQKSVINKYLKNLDNDKVIKAFEQFKQFYGDKLRLSDILHLKEENYQEGFLREIFVQSLGYTIRPDLNYNLTTEYKNQTDSKKADGAIIQNNSAIGVIELKSAKTFNLENIRNQAFNYKNNQPDCRYVITSNFHYLRFYIDNSTEYEEFDLFEFKEQDFKLFYLILSQESIFNNIPLKMKEETKYHEENISDKFYKDYKAFKDQIFENLVKNNTQYDKLTLFKKSQKLLDRFLFVYFGEDSGLCPPNSIQKIIDQWKTLKSNDAYAPLYNRFQKLFNYLDVGKKLETFEFPGYNGGLFKPDELLDHEKTIIEDNLLLMHCPKLSAYDFNTDIDVNILGHIFEHSLNEIEEISAELKGEAVEKSKTKRKKDGVFYTPKYITTYIVESTVGKLCKDKQEELEISQIEITELYSKNGKITKQGKELFTKFQEYKNWLITLKILDPACGSGAFLNSALDFLIKEHKQIDDLISDLTGDKLRMFDTDKNILENNIFGVDINEESVEIAKLSLWLRTAKKDRKLSDLNNNIKCGNSLIDSPEIAGNKVFDWKTEFSGIVGNGGFDVVIGNPPYVRVEFIPENQVAYYKDKYVSASNKFDLSSLFIEKSISLLKSKGLYSIISSYQFIYANSGIGLRQFITNNASTEIIKFSSESQLFDGATTYTGIFIFSRSINSSIIIKDAYTLNNEIVIKSLNHLSNENFSSQKVIVGDSSVYDKILANNSIVKGNQLGSAKTGVVSSADEIFFVSSETVNANNFEKEIIYPILGPDDLESWFLNEPSIYCIYPYYQENDKTKLYSIDKLMSDFPNVYNYLNQFSDKLKSRSQGRKDYSESLKWYQLNRPREKWIYDSIKIIYPGTTNRPKFALDTNRQLFRNARLYAFVPKHENPNLLKYLLCILNSSLCYYLMKLKTPPKNNNYFELSTGFIDDFPFILINEEEQKAFIDLANLQIESSLRINSLKNKFYNRILSNLKINSLNTRLKDFYKYDFKIFIEEINKQKVKLKLTEQDEWEEYFVKYSNEINNSFDNLKSTNIKINKMVYDLYELTKEEIALVEGIS